MGLASYFRKFIPGFAEIAKPLTDLLRKGAAFKIGPAQEEAFEQLKVIMSRHPVLLIFLQGVETEVHTDASAQATGAILMQKSPEDNKFHPVYYMSRKTTPAESRYCSYELEILAVIKALARFRVYLLGTHFRVVTDCIAFRQTLLRRDLNPRIARWVLALEEFDFEVVHRAGKKMKHVDALSRMLVIRDGLIERISRAQVQDPYLAAIRKALEAGPYDNFIVWNGVICKVVGDAKLVALPKAMQGDVFRNAHELGHFGTKKTMEVLQRNYWMPNMAKRVDQFIQNCVACILGNRKAGKQEGLLNPIVKEDVPFDTIHLDHVGPLERTSKKGYQHLLVLVDSFTKFVWIFPTKSTGAGEVLDKLKLHRQTFGNPRRFISDRGAAFTSGEFEDYCEVERIHHYRITTGVPRGNGQVERVNAIVEQVFRRLSVTSPEKWYKKVPQVQRAINATYQRSIGTTPFELLFGTSMNGKEDVKLVRMIEEEQRGRFDDDRRALRESARLQIEKLQSENSRTYNRKRKEATAYQVGDLVAILRTQQGPGLKLAVKFLGPYRVTRVNGNDRYSVTRIRDSEGPAVTTSSADHMKPWRGFTDDLDVSDWDSENDGNTDGETEDEASPADSSPEAGESQDGRDVGSEVATDATGKAATKAVSRSEHPSRMTRASCARLH